MTIEMFQRDERPYWVATITVDDVAEDMTTGFTFEVNLATTATAETPALTKTTGITGGPAGVVTVAWTPNELDLPAGTYVAQLTATRTSDSKELTVQDKIKIKPRLT